MHQPEMPQSEINTPIFVSDSREELFLPGRLLRFLGVLPDKSKTLPVAEMIPVEPDQGNACAGKVINSMLFFPFAAFPQ
jgi:hypothetical protein